jgi:hypothetical protein
MAISYRLVQVTGSGGVCTPRHHDRSPACRARSTRALVGGVLVASVLVAATARAGAPPKLTAAELDLVYKAAHITVRGARVLDDCDKPVEPTVDVIDLNGDGQPEVFVLLQSACYGAVGGQLTLLIKDKQGFWRPNLGFPAGGYTLLKTKNEGYPDIEIGGVGKCSPVWRWNGKAYDIHKRCEP